MKKEIFGLIVFVVVIIAMFVYCVDRFDKINNGEMIVVSENEMDR